VRIYIPFSSDSWSLRLRGSWETIDLARLWQLHPLVLAGVWLRAWRETLLFSLFIMHEHLFDCHFLEAVNPGTPTKTTLRLVVLLIYLLV
jgi:hypothetical protein